ncbi:MAG: hypothetical protein R3B60_04035 [Candidatus Paceibacterota bacterium]
MKLVLLSGGAGVGKRTVGESLSKLTDFPLIHNHLTRNIVKLLLGEYDKSNARTFDLLLFTLRKEIILAALNNDNLGLIMTHANHEKVGYDYYLWLRSLCSRLGIEFVVINLVCSEEKRQKRFLSKERLKLDKPADTTIFDRINSEWGLPKVIEDDSVNLLTVDTNRMAASLTADAIFVHIL